MKGKVRGTWKEVRVVAVCVKLFRVCVWHEERELWWEEAAIKRCSLAR